jgi:hypothetical protein
MSTLESRLPAISSFAASAATAMIWANGAPTRTTGAGTDLDPGHEGLQYFCRRTFIVLERGGHRRRNARPFRHHKRGDAGVVYDASTGAMRASYWRTRVDEDGHYCFAERQTAHTARS